MLKTSKTFAEYTSRLICLSALSEGNRYSKPSEDQSYIRSIHAHIGLYYYGELDDVSKTQVVEKITADYNAIKDLDLKETVRVLLEE